MSVELYSLASGSSGNVMLMRGLHGDLLLDCGMSRSYIEKTVGRMGLDPCRIRAIVVTHEHTDHTRGIVSMARKYKMPIIGSMGTLQSIVGASDLPTQILKPDCPVSVDEFQIDGQQVHHDACEPLSLIVSTKQARIGYAVDLGYPSARLMQSLSLCDLVVLEANYDRRQLIHGPYSNALKERILGDNGHLSNEDAAKVIRELTRMDRPFHFWLAHLSAVNNRPQFALDAAIAALNQVSRKRCFVEVALRDRPSVRWHSTDRWWQPSIGI